MGAGRDSFLRGLIPCQAWAQNGSWSYWIAQVPANISWTGNFHCRCKCVNIWEHFNYLPVISVSESGTATQPKGVCGARCVQWCCWLDRNWGLGGCLLGDDVIVLGLCSLMSHLYQQKLKPFFGTNVGWGGRARCVQPHPCPEPVWWEEVPGGSCSLVQVCAAAGMGSAGWSILPGERKHNPFVLLALGSTGSAPLLTPRWAQHCWVCPSVWMWLCWEPWVGSWAGGMVVLVLLLQPGTRCSLVKDVLLAPVQLVHNTSDILF